MDCWEKQIPLPSMMVEMIIFGVMFKVVLKSGKTPQLSQKINSVELTWQQFHLFLMRPVPLQCELGANMKCHKKVDSARTDTKHFAISVNNFFVMKSVL